MTVDEIRARVEEIRALAGDDERAHAEEDSLYAEVLRAISRGECDNPDACAAEALKTEEIKFCRWCA